MTTKAHEQTGTNMLNKMKLFLLYCQSAYTFLSMSMMELFFHYYRIGISHDIAIFFSFQSRCEPNQDFH